MLASLSSAFFLVVASATLVSSSASGYVLEDDYSTDKFFSMFDFFTAPDPTHGYVSYIGQSAAQSAGLINTNNGAIYMGVDYTNVASGSGRQSVRITSKKSYTHGLIILDLSHMPGGICGTWPAFWTVGPNWPKSGEIDIIEGVNSQTGNSMALHTGPGCSIVSNGLFDGQITTPNCDVAASGQATNAGCQIHSPNKASYGTGFNAIQGGVFATEWTSDHISIWFFPRGGIPSDISSGNPEPSGWGQPSGSFTGGCDVDNFFMNNQIVFDTTFCGDWAGNVWSTDPVCSSKASTCQQFVRDNPAAFKDAFWSVNSLKVYQSGSGGSKPQPGVPSQGPGVNSIVPTISGGVVPLPSSAPGYGDQSVGQTQTSEAGNAWGGGGGRYTRSWGGKANFAAVESSVPTVSAVASSAGAFNNAVAPIATTSSGPIAAIPAASSAGAIPNAAVPSSSAVPLPAATNADVPAAAPQTVAPAAPAATTTPAPAAVATGSSNDNVNNGNFGAGFGEKNGIYYTITALPTGYFDNDERRKRDASPLAEVDIAAPLLDTESLKRSASLETEKNMQKRAADKASHLLGHRLVHRHIAKRGTVGKRAADER